MSCLHAGLVDDDFGMELLVGGAIISLNLPVRLVWECIWRPTLGEVNTDDDDDDEDDDEEEEDHAALAGLDMRGVAPRGDIEVMGPPMVVTYRLQASCAFLCAMFDLPLLGPGQCRMAAASRSGAQDLLCDSTVSLQDCPGPQQLEMLHWILTMVCPTPSAHV